LIEIVKPFEECPMRAVSHALVAVALAWSAAAAQNNPDQLPPATSGSAPSTGKPASSAREAPIGHRQPRAKDMPSWIQENLGTRSLEDETIDRKLRI
jgi:hypothetical protein